MLAQTAEMKGKLMPFHSIPFSSNAEATDRWNPYGGEISSMACNGTVRKWWTIREVGPDNLVAEVQRFVRGNAKLALGSICGWVLVENAINSMLRHGRLVVVRLVSVTCSMEGDKEDELERAQPPAPSTVPSLFGVVVNSRRKMCC
uniref:Uncharacterized protein n=1 Tax=Globodera rostochiensis TaxID=31243 RepID=A0A914I7X9_GLORO